MKRKKVIALIQPLPALVYDEDQHLYSEFDSLGLSLLGAALREAGHVVEKISYPSNDVEVRSAIDQVDAVVLGDFRYYTYFCNPLPLIKRTLEILTSNGFVGEVFVAGRHSAYFPKNLNGGAVTAPYKVHWCPNLEKLAEVLELPISVSERLGRSELPNPAHIPVDLLLSDSLSGSASRPVGGTTGQLIITTGCRYRCAFCEKAGTRLNSLSPEILQAQLGQFKSRGVKYLIIWDEVFGQDVSCRDSYLKALANADVRFGCNTRIDMIGERFIEDLALAGCHSVLFGLELQSEESKARRDLRVDKGKSPDGEKLGKLVEDLAAAGIAAVGSLVIGLAEDTPETIAARLSYFKSLGFAHLYARPLVPFPGSWLYSQELLKGNIEPFETWAAADLNSYPLGYPTLCKNLGRKELCRITKQPV